MVPGSVNWFFDQWLDTDKRLDYSVKLKKDQDSDIIIFPSIWPEPFGRIAIEGLAARKIVIGSNIGGIKETLNEGGILVEPNNPKKLREAIRNGIKIKKTDLSNYSEQSVINKFIKIYKK